MVTCLSVEPSTGLAILIWAPDIWRISLIFAPWRPIMQPMSWVGQRKMWEHEEKIETARKISLLRKWHIFLTNTLKKQTWDKRHLHRLEWSAHESQFVQRHPSQLKKYKESPWVCWLCGLLQIYSNRNPPFNLSTYPGSPGCYVQWGRGSAAWPAGEVWWAVETMEERMWRGKQTQTETMSEESGRHFNAEIL